MVVLSLSHLLTDLTERGVLSTYEGPVRVITTYPGRYTRFFPKLCGSVGVNPAGYVTGRSGGARLLLCFSDCVLVQVYTQGPVIVIESCVRGKCPEKIYTYVEKTYIR